MLFMLWECSMKASSIIAASALTILGLWLSACGQGAKSSDSAAAAAAGYCGAGQVYLSQYLSYGTNGCFPNAQCVSMGANYGYVNGVGCVAGVAGTGIGGGGIYGTSSHLYSGRLSFAASRGPFRDLLRSMNFCDLGIWNIGDQDCNAWDDQARLDLSVNPGALPVQAILVIHLQSNFSGYVYDYPVYGTLYSTGSDSGATNTGVEFRGLVATRGISVKSGQPIVSNGILNPQLSTTITTDGSAIGTSTFYLKW